MILDDNHRMNIFSIYSYLIRIAVLGRATVHMAVLVCCLFVAPYSAEAQVKSQEQSRSKMQALPPAYRSAELEIQFHRAKMALTSGNSLYEAKVRIDRVLKTIPEDVDAL